jgi:hypothetical protein
MEVIPSILRYIVLTGRRALGRFCGSDMPIAQACKMPETVANPLPGNLEL